jgi:cytochrome P450
VTADAAAHALFDLDAGAIRCPHTVFAALRREQPVSWSPRIEAFVVTRHDDIVEVLHHPERFGSRLATGPVLARQMAQTFAELAAEDDEARGLLAAQRAYARTPVLLNADPPLHGRQRSLVSRAFTPRKVQRREAAIADISRGLIDRFAGDGHVELVRQFAVPLPLTVIADALGVPVERMDDFKRWSDDFVVAIGNDRLTKADLGRLLRTQAEFYQYFAEQIDDRRLRRDDLASDIASDLVSDIVDARVDGQALSTGEMLGMFAQFLVAGNETTTKLITSAVLHLARDPEVAESLRRDPESVGPFVEEVLRLEAPVQGLYRLATEDTEVGGVPIPAGSSLWLVDASANRDEAHFPAPDECRPGRPGTSPHLSFGLGEHFCLGASLARAEARIAVQQLVARLADIRLAGARDDGVGDGGVGVEGAQLEYEPSYVLHGLKRLELTFSPV